MHISGNLPPLTNELDIAADISNTEALKRYAETAVSFMVLQYPEVDFVIFFYYEGPIHVFIIRFITYFLPTVYIFQLFDADTVNSWNSIKLVYKEFTDTFVAPFNEMYSLQINDGSSPWCVQGRIKC